jgi:hypothetical protein
LLIVLEASGSQIKTSASAPCYITPLRGYMLKILAVWEEVARTKSDAVIAPVLTPLVHTTDILSSIPLQPFGIFVKLSLPMRFC